MAGAVSRRAGTLSYRKGGGMEDSEFELLKAEIAAANDYTQEWVLYSKRVKLPDDPLRWLDKLEAQMPAALSRAPQVIADDFESLLVRQIRLCRRALSQDDEEHIKIFFAVLNSNWNRLASNIDLKEARETRVQRSEAGRTRHAETEGMKKFVVQYYEEHKPEFKSKRAAAKAIHEARLVLAAESTIYTWLRSLD